MEHWTVFTVRKIHVSSTTSRESCGSIGIVRGPRTSLVSVLFYSFSLLVGIALFLVACGSSLQLWLNGQCTTGRRKWRILVSALSLVISSGWRRSVVVRTLVSAGELSLSCARLLAGWVTTLQFSHPLSVNQHGKLSHPSLRGR